MDPAQLQAYQADWVYFCVWSGEFIDGGVWNTLDFLKDVYNDPYVLTLDEITGWKSGGGSTPGVSTSVVDSVTSRSSSSAAGSPATTTRQASTTLRSSVTVRTSVAPTQTGAVVPKWQQCGGSGYSGPTQCVAGSTCTKHNDFYWQCV